MNILDIACILVSITGSIASFLSLKWVLIKREPKEEKDEGRIRRLNIYFLFMTLITAMLSVMMRKFYNEEFLDTVFVLMMLNNIWPAAYTDVKKMKIYNETIIYGFIFRGILIVPEIMYYGFSKDYCLRILSCAIAIGMIFLAGVICRLIIKNSIGAGDIKLLAMMAAYLGINKIGAVVFCSLLVAFFYCLYLLIKKKVSKKDAIPFGPSIIIGAYIAVFLGTVI